MTDPTPELEQKLGVAVERMPAFPRSVQRVLELTRDINCKPKEIVAVIEKDPVLTVNILKVINSAHYALARRVSSINQSIIHLGINTIKNLSLSVAAAGMVPSGNDAGFDSRRYLVHSLACAGIARQLCIAYKVEDTDPGDCYVTGLLHDFGKVVFARFMTKEFMIATEISEHDGVPLSQAERQSMGVDHGYVGAILAARWNFPEHLVTCIRDHHNNEAPRSGMMDCLRAADQISRGVGLEGDAAYSPDIGEAAVSGRFDSSVEAVISRLGNLQEIIREAHAFAAVGKNQ